jgi:ectoine hydroxylase-related dioxygenase (phytanoyl-CoA dioxygenase family)
MTLSVNGIELKTDPDKLGELRDANDLLDDIDALKARMEDDGYLLFRNFLDREAVLKAREEILLKYAIVGEIDAINHPLMDAIYSEQSFIDQVNLIAFTESIRSGVAYENVIMNEKLVKFFERWFGRGPVRTFDFKWPRFFRPGEGTGLHCDSPYINRGTLNLYSAWIPLGDVNREGGTLLVLENSHKSERLRETYSRKDADRDKLGWLSTDPVKLQKNIGGRWLTTDFRAGDVFIFNIYLVHGGTDNTSPENRCRLTSDTRYQLADEPLDERWNGGNVNPHGGRRVFLPGLGKWNNNKEFEEEWKPVDDYGRLLMFPNSTPSREEAEVVART